MKYIVNMNKEYILTFTIDANGESVIKPKYYNDSNNLYFNKTATFILKEIENKAMSIEDIAKYLMKKYQLNNFSEILNDVIDILKQFWTSGIISFVGKDNMFEQNYKLKNGDVIKKCSHEDTEQILSMLKKEEFIIYSNPYINKNIFMTSDSIHANIINNTIIAFFYTGKNGISELFIVQEDSIVSNIQILLMYTKSENVQNIQEHFTDLYRCSLSEINETDGKMVLEVAHYNEKISAFINLLNLKLIGTLKEDSLYGDVDVYRQQ